MQRRVVQACAGCALMTVGALSGGGQALAKGGNNLDGLRSSYDARDVPESSYSLYPSLDIAVGYDDNIFAAESGEIDDAFLRIEPRVMWKSNWNRHALEFDSYARWVMYDEQTDEDRMEWGAGFAGQLDASQSTVFAGNARFDRLAEDRGSVDAAGLASEPTEYDVAAGALSLTQRFNRFSLGFGASMTAFDYDDVDMIGGGLIDQDFRDHNIQIGFAEAKYDFSPGYSAVLYGEFNKHDYDLDVDDLDFDPLFNVDRDSEGYKVEAGLDLDVTNLIKGRFMAGYVDQDYEDPSLIDIEGTSYSADLIWSLSGMTTLRAEAKRDIEDTAFGLVGGRFATSYKVALDHEMMRNFFVTGQAEFKNYDFEGSAREDDLIIAGLGMRYLVNRRAMLDLTYEHSERESNFGALDYERNVVQLDLKIHR